MQALTDQKQRGLSGGNRRNASHAMAIDAEVGQAGEGQASGDWRGSAWWVRQPDCREMGNRGTRKCGPRTDTSDVWPVIPLQRQEGYYQRKFTNRERIASEKSKKSHTRKA
jgi:hypothetical protein